MIGGRVSVDVRKVDVEGQESSALDLTDLRNVPVGVTSQLLIEYRGHIEASSAQKLGGFCRQVLVGLEGRHVPTSWIGMSRSRASSAAYCIAAWTSSVFKDG